MSITGLAHLRRRDYLVRECGVLHALLVGVSLLDQESLPGLSPRLYDALFHYINLLHPAMP